MGWLIAPDAVVIVDSQFPETAQMFLDGLKERTSRHAGATCSSTPTITGITQPATRRFNRPSRQPSRMPKRAAVAAEQAAERNTEAAQAYPDTTFEDSWSLDLGSELVSAKHDGPGHTGGDGAGCTNVTARDRLRLAVQ